MSHESNIIILIEPRRLPVAVQIIENFKQKLPNWEFIFYCGKGNTQFYVEIIEALRKQRENDDENKQHKFLELGCTDVEFRELDTNNFTPTQYNDFLKSKELWQSLNGNYVLTCQCDTWLNLNGPSIDEFLGKYAYLGGNMNYNWPETGVLQRMKIVDKNETNGAFNGGLSLRCRKDMLAILDAIPPLPTEIGNGNAIPEILKLTNFEDCYKFVGRCAEDVYFTLGCFLLGLRTGDDDLAKTFACHTVFMDNPFGYHLSQPSCDLVARIKKSGIVIPFI